jgi:hypothetical protein
MGILATALEFAAISGSVFGTALLHVRDEKSSGTAGGTATSGSFDTRTLNTVVTNEISGASLTSNQIILPTGTYYIHASAPAYNVNSSRIKLRNITDSSDTIIGSTENATTSTVHSFAIGRFTIAAQKTFELQHRVQSSNNTEGLGVLSNFSVTEVYADVQIWKVA